MGFMTNYNSSTRMGRHKILIENMQLTKGMINIKHYREWHEKNHIPLCNCLGPGFPSTMCCDNYYVEEFNLSDWTLATPLFDGFFKINVERYRVLRKLNPTFLMFIALLSNSATDKNWTGGLLNAFYTEAPYWAVSEVIE